MEKVLKDNPDLSVDRYLTLLFAEANEIAREDIETNQTMARYGNEIVPEGATILTHCNAGALATVDYGTGRCR